MSVLNVFPGHDRVLFAVDTAAAMVASPQAVTDSTPGLDLNERGASKIVPLVHAGAVIAGRGNLLFLATAFGRMLCETDRDFDVLCDRLASACNDAARVISAAAEAHGFKAPGELGEVVMAGWSRRLKTMRTVAVFADQFGGMELYDLEQPWITPGVEGFPVFPPAPSAAEIQRVTIEQVLHFRSAADPCYGGSMIMAEVSRRGVRFDWSVDIERQAAMLTTAQPEGLPC